VPPSAPRCDPARRARGPTAWPVHRTPRTTLAALALCLALPAPAGRAAEPAPAFGLPALAPDLTGLQADFDIPIAVNAQVLRAIREYRAPGARRGFARWLSRSRGLGPPLRAILREQGVPQDLIYLAMVESGFTMSARSAAGAVGPWQLIAATGRRFGLRVDRWVDERRDPEKAARAAALFLRALYVRTGDWHLAWAAYNAGPARLDRVLRRTPAGFWELERRRLLPAETRAYVPRILAAAIIARHPEAFGFREEELRPEGWVDYELVVIPRATSLARLAAVAGVELRALRALNPELRRGLTPPRAYLLKLPRAAAGVFAERWGELWPRPALIAAR
jgi:membrane-bound lytic murein transglycosylase D